MSLYPNPVVVFPKSTPSLRNISLRSNLLPSRRISLLRGKLLPRKCSLSSKSAATISLSSSHSLARLR
jgi:hypothetical protein